MRAEPPIREAQRRRAALPSSSRRLATRLAGLLAAMLAVTLAIPSLPLAGPATAGIVSGSLVVRAEGRAPVQGGRSDVAYQQALDEAMRHALLESLRTVAPERQSPHDLETWQETVLSRAVDFVAAWRVLALEEKDGFLVLEASVEIWPDKLARAAHATGAGAAAPALRLLVLGDSFPLLDRAADEEVDAGRQAAAALEAEFARRGAVIVSSAERAAWDQSSGPASDEFRVALAATAARRLEADAVLVVRISQAPGGLTLSGQLIAVASESTLGTGRVAVPLPGEVALAEALAPAAHSLASTLAPRLASLRSGRARGLSP